MPNKTLDIYLNHADQAVGSQLDARIQHDLVNDAGSYLFDMHNWPWAIRDGQKLPLIEGQNYVELPADFQQMIKVTAVDRLVREVYPVSLGTIDELRGTIAAEGVTDWYYAIEWPGQFNTGENAPTARLSLYPTPSSDTYAELRIRYRAGWVPLTKMDQAPNIPSDMEPLLIQLVRAFALGYMDEQRGQGAVTNRLEPIEQSAMLARLKSRYGTVQGNMGYQRGGVTKGPDEHGYYYRHDQITVN